MYTTLKSIPNRMAGTCHVCGTPVGAYAGFADLTRNSMGGEKWRTRCGRCGPINLGSPAERAQAEAKAARIDAERAAIAPELAPAKTPTLDELGDALKDAPFVAEAEAVAALMAAALAESEQRIVEGTAAQFTATVPAMVAELLATARPIEIAMGKAEPVKVDLAHAMLPIVLAAIAAGASPFLVGPAGSGKTTLGQQVAKVLKRPFYMASRVTSEYKLTGFVDANGKCTRTQFREAYEHGGVFLFDEVDASDPDAMTAFNAALSNGHADFPDGMVKRHKDFVAIAAGNTYGRGADRQYVGRNQLDAATLDRFQVFDVDYDKELEHKLAGNAEWTNYVQAVRAAVDAEKVRHIVSPRASIMGARMLAQGMDRKAVEDACIWKGLDQAQRDRITAHVRNGGL